MPILFQRLHHRSSVTIKFFFFFLASEYSTVIYTLYNWIFNSNFFLKVFSFRIEKNFLKFLRLGLTPVVHRILNYI